MTNYEKLLSTVSLDGLLTLWETVHGEPTIREWIMDELERRDPIAFDEWLSSDYDPADPEAYKPRRYFLK